MRINQSVTFILLTLIVCSSSFGQTQEEKVSLMNFEKTCGNLSRLQYKIKIRACINWIEYFKKKDNLEYAGKKLILISLAYLHIGTEYFLTKKYFESKKAYKQAELYFNEHLDNIFYNKHYQENENKDADFAVDIFTCLRKVNRKLGLVKEVQKYTYKLNSIKNELLISYKQEQNSNYFTEEHVVYYIKQYPRNIQNFLLYHHYMYSGFIKENNNLYDEALEFYQKALSCTEINFDKKYKLLSEYSIIRVKYYYKDYILNNPINEINKILEIIRIFKQEGIFDSTEIDEFYTRNLLLYYNNGIVINNFRRQLLIDKLPYKTYIYSLLGILYFHSNSFSRSLKYFEMSFSDIQDNCAYLTEFTGHAYTILNKILSITINNNSSQSVKLHKGITRTILSALISIHSHRTCKENNSSDLSDFNERLVSLYFKSKSFLKDTNMIEEFYILQINNAISLLKKYSTASKEEYYQKDGSVSLDKEIYLQEIKKQVTDREYSINYFLNEYKTGIYIFSKDKELIFKPVIINNVPEECKSIPTSSTFVCINTMVNNYHSLLGNTKIIKVKTKTNGIQYIAETISSKSNFQKKGKVILFKGKPYGTVEEEISPENVNLLTQHHRDFLQEILFQPVIEEIKKESQNKKPELLISLYGSLHKLPISTFNFSGYEIKNIQSPTLLRKIRTREKHSYKNENPLYAIGNSVYDVHYNSTKKSQLANLDTKDKEPKKILKNDQWNSFKYSQEEMESITGMIYSKENEKYILSGIASNHSEVMQMSKNGDFKNYRVLYFSVHGIYYESNPEKNALILTIPKSVQDKIKDLSPISTFHAEFNSYLKTNKIGIKSKKDFSDESLKYKLSLGDIRSLNLNTELVVLSACETALGDYISGEGIVGIPQAFQLAGARYVLATLWSVDEDVTMVFMKAFFDKIKDPLRNRDSIDYYKTLREVQAEFKNGKHGEEYKAPYNWAGFVLYGD